MSEERKRRRAITEKRVRLAALLIFLLFFGMFGGGYVYAKYYSQSMQKGIAIASGIYFTSNYAVASGENEFFESIVKNGYNGQDTDFEFEVRNYENNMLFNESSVVIPYSLYFWLGEDPVDATYTVSCESETLTLGVGSNNKVGFEEQEITGGRAAANKYTIAVDVEEGAEHTSVPVFVEVMTDEGAVISKELRGKMIFSTVGLAESYIQAQGFTVTDFNEIAGLSELTYEIKTVGTVVGDDNTEELRLSWDPTVLEINMFGEAFQAWKKTSGQTEPLQDAENSGWVYITVKVMPYSAETIGFFRGSDFDTKVTSLEELNQYVEAEKVIKEDS